MLPPYFAPRPGGDPGPRTIADFERLFVEVVSSANVAAIAYQIAAPKWQFLRYLCERKEIVLHGSGRADIAEFEPRQSDDVEEFGARRAVYAASDGIWPIYFAVVDRTHATSLLNACFRVVEEDGSRSEPYYFFSIDGGALAQRPWRRGTIYLLPRATFQQQPARPYRGAQVEVAQWASAVPVRPMARLAVGPEDFPFLGQVYPHDPRSVLERARLDPGGFPWFED